MWYQLAWQLGYPVNILKQMVPISEWLGWVQFFAIEPNLFHREDWYFAKLVATIKAGQAGKKGGTFYVKDELIKFASDNQPIVRRSLKERVETSKSRHMACLGEYGAALSKEAHLT